MKRIPMPRIFALRGRGAGHGGGMFTVIPDPSGYDLRVGPVEEQDQSQGPAQPGQPEAPATTAATKQGESAEMVSFNTQFTGPAGEYVPEEDVVQELPDGRTIQVAVKGVPIPYAVAFQKGLVDEKGKPRKQAAVGPSETKETPKKGSAPSQGGDAETASTTDSDSGDERTSTK